MANFNNEFTINAISPIDGRYASKIHSELNNINSEYGLIKKRLFVEIEWFIFLTSLSNIKKKFPLSKIEKDYIRKIYKNFDKKEALKVKNIENKIKHDVKSIEFYLNTKFDAHKSLKNKKNLFIFAQHQRI